MESKAVWGQGGRYLDFGGSVGAESDQGWRLDGNPKHSAGDLAETRGLGEIEPRRKPGPAAAWAAGSSRQPGRARPGRVEDALAPPDTGARQIFYLSYSTNPL